MKLLGVLLVVLSYWTADCCQPDWYNRCQSNGECCSNNCYKPGNWADGLCRPREQRSSNCMPDWNNRCQSDPDCCSRFCYRPGDWAHGICRAQGSCKKDWDNRCKTSSDCCSSNCYRPGNWEFGVCYPPQEYLDRLPPCSTAPRSKRAVAQYVCKEIFRPCKQGFKRIMSSSGGRTEFCRKAY